MSFGQLAVTFFVLLFVVFFHEIAHAIAAVK